MWIDVYRCCYETYDTRSDFKFTTGKLTKTEKVGEIRIAKSKQYSEWIDDPSCQKPDIDPITGKQKIDPITNLPIFLTGKRLVIRQYLSLEDLKTAFPFVDGYNLKVTGPGVLENVLVNGWWSGKCQEKWNDVIEGAAVRGIDAARQVYINKVLSILDPSLQNPSFVPTIVKKQINKAKLNNGNPVTITGPVEEIIELCNIDPPVKSADNECCFTGPCVFQTQPPGPPGFWCVEVDSPEKIKVIESGGDGYDDNSISSILGGFVPVDLLKRIIKENGVLKDALTAAEKAELEDLIVRSRGNYTDMGSTGKEIKENYAKLFNLSARKYRIQIQEKHVDYFFNVGVGASELYNRYAKIFEGLDPVTGEPIYTHYLVLDTLEELLKYANLYSVLVSSALGTPNVTEERTNESRIISGSERTQVVPGFPCEVEDIADFEDKWNLYYTAYKICYRSDGSISVEPIRDSSGNIKRFFYAEEWREDPTRLGEPIPNTRRYDPNSMCCENDPDFFKPDPGSGTPPIYNHTYLKYDLTDLGYEWVSSNPDDPCDCIQYKIADVYCYYDLLGVATQIGKFPKYRRNIKDKRTWVIDPVTGKIETRRKATADCEEDRDWRVYHPFDKKRDIIKGERKHITRGLFNLREHMDCYYTSSLQSAESKKYYYDVMDCDDCDRGPYFAVAYGHVSGSGSSHVDEYSLDKSPSDAIYSQYQSLCFDVTQSAVGERILPKFSFVSSSTLVETPHIYVINFYRDGIIDRLDAGNFQINLAELSGSFYANNVHTGSNVKVASPKIMSLIDDSNQFDEGIVCDGGELIAYNIVSGTLTGGIYEPSSSNTYGKVFPQLGVIVLDASRFDEILGFNSVTGSDINGDNAFKLFTSISGAATPISGSGRDYAYHLTARSIKYRSTQHYFVRVYPNYTNYSNSPTFYKPLPGVRVYESGSRLLPGNYVKYDCFINDPQVYVTSVGLYNDNRELLAIAKLSRPVKKNFDNELLIKVRLHW